MVLKTSLKNNQLVLVHVVTHKPFSGRPMRPSYILMLRRRGNESQSQAFIINVSWRLLALKSETVRFLLCCVVCGAPSAAHLKIKLESWVGVKYHPDIFTVKVKNGSRPTWMELKLHVKLLLGFLTEKKAGAHQAYTLQRDWEKDYCVLQLSLNIKSLFCLRVQLFGL